MPVRPIVHAFAGNWAGQAADAIQQAIEVAIRARGECSVMLTGGVTVQSIYRLWGTRPDFPHARVIYYFGDERCVAADHPESNYGAACRSLFGGGIPGHVRIFPMDGSLEDVELAASCYARLLPEQIDVLLLGMGEDGHIASLFPGSPATTEMSRRVVATTGPKPPPRRISITPRVIGEARVIFLLATGQRKGKVLARALKGGDSVRELPVRLALRATWLLDRDAGQELVEDFACE